MVSASSLTNMSKFRTNRALEQSVKSNVGRRSSVFPNVRSTIFNGIDEYIDSVGTTSSYNFIENTGVFTISLWCKLTDNTSIDGFSYMGNNSGGNPNGFSFLWDNRAAFNKNVRIVITQGISVIIDSSSSNNIIADNDWHHIVCTGNATNVFFYVDNVKETGSGTMSTLGSGVSKEILQFGRINNVSSLLMDGNFKDISIWNDTLSDVEVSEIYHSGTPDDLLNHSAFSDLVGWWRMGDGDVFPTIFDRSVNSNNGSMTNMAANNFVADTP